MKAATMCQLLQTSLMLVMDGTFTDYVIHYLFIAYLVLLASPLRRDYPEESPWQTVEQAVQRLNP